MFTNSQPGVAAVDDLVSSVERVHVEAELAKERVNLAVMSLGGLVTYDFGQQADAVETFAAFLESIKASEDQAQVLRNSIERMKSAAGPVFDKWNEDIGAFSNAALRDRSAARLAKTQSRYDAIVDSSEPALVAIDTFNLGIRDHALFLEHDFNPASVAEIKSGVQELRTLAAELDDRFEDTLRAARAYFETRELPVERSAGPATDVAQPPAGK